MKVLEKGTPREWSTEAVCTGEGNGGFGCGAKLLVERTDLYKTYKYSREDVTQFITFRCSECKKETDLSSRVVSQMYPSLIMSIPIKEEFDNHTLNNIGLKDKQNNTR